MVVGRIWGGHRWVCGRGSNVPFARGDCDVGFLVFFIGVGQGLGRGFRMFWSLFSGGFFNDSSSGSFLVFFFGSVHPTK